MHKDARTFSIADATLLIAGLAAGFGLLRATAPDIPPDRLWNSIAYPKDGWSLWHVFGICVEGGPLLLFPLVAGWTPACLLVQVNRPRAPWRRLRRQPGFVACLIATFVVLTSLVVATACVTSTTRCQSISL
jgi:hypothetical protein